MSRTISEHSVTSPAQDNTSAESGPREAAPEPLRDSGRQHLRMSASAGFGEKKLQTRLLLPSHLACPECVLTELKGFFNPFDPASYAQPMR